MKKVDSHTQVVLNILGSFLKKLSTGLPYNLVVLLLDKYPRELKFYVLMCISVYSNIIIAPNWK